MKNWFIIILIIAIAISCNNKGNTINTESKSIDSIVNKEQLITQAKLLDGYWISNNYLSEIEKTKSIYLNRQYDSKLFGFTLDKKNLLSDTAYLNGFTDHEGGYGSPLIFDFKKNTFVNDLKRLEKSASLPDSFELQIINENLIEMVSKAKFIDKYRKVVDDQTELRKILFAGNYTSTDSHKKFSFDKNGSLQGFDNKVYYELAYDFGEGISYDAIILYKSKKGGNWSDGDLYKFEFISDTLKLYHVKQNWESMQHTIEGLAYKLVKVNNR